MTNANSVSPTSIDLPQDEYRYRFSLLDALAIPCMAGIPVLAISLGFILRDILSNIPG